MSKIPAYIAGALVGLVVAIGLNALAHNTIGNTHLGDLKSSAPTTSGLTIGDDACVTFGDDSNYTICYDSANTWFQIASTDVDGGGTDGDVIRVTDGGDDIVIVGTLAGATATSGLVIGNASASTTVPVLTFQGDTNTGLGQAAADNPCLIAGGVKAYCVAESSLDITSQTFYLGDFSPAASLNMDFATETLTFAAGPTGDASKTTSSTLLPDGAVLFDLTSRVITAGTNCTSVDIGDGTDVDLFADNASVADTSTTRASDWTANVAMPMLSDGEVTVTAVGGNCFGLSIRIRSLYMNGAADGAD